MESDQLDYDARRSEQVKFKQQMALGIGGAMVFGLVSALGGGLVGLTSSTASWTVPLLAATLPVSGLAMAGLGLLGVVGVGAIFLGSKYLAESIRIDQDRQAQRIGKIAGFGPGPVVAPAPAIDRNPTKTVTAAPPGMGVQGAHHEKAHAEKADHHSSLQHAVPHITETASIERLHSAPGREVHA